ncbi:hypothetical protein [Paraburkholderia atlantica]|uniref:hypothetical protein n=1 Tax=Paraburkholderia atlantica TaxID=2654982 RepID=UPI0012FEA091|nr:hypothetical protein [Paraburkholderia atlantica]
MKTGCSSISFVEVIIIAGLMLFSIDVKADEITLCYPHEEVYFSCPTDGKIMSVCASGNISPDNGYVQYRFGKMDKIEMEFPKNPFSPRKWFSLSDIHEGNVSFTHLKFMSGRYQYVLYQGFPSGIYIKRGGKTISNHICDDGAYQPINSRVFRGIKTVEPVDGIDN